MRFLCRASASFHFVRWQEKLTAICVFVLKWLVCCDVNLFVKQMGAFTSICISCVSCSSFQESRNKGNVLPMHLLRSIPESLQAPERVLQLARIQTGFQFSFPLKMIYQSTRWAFVNRKKQGYPSLYLQCRRSYPGIHLERSREKQSTTAWELSDRWWSCILPFYEFSVLLECWWWSFLIVWGLGVGLGRKPDGFI